MILSMKARYIYHPLKFIRPGGTSRGVLTEKDSWYIILEDKHRQGIGEASLIEGLNPESRVESQAAIEEICQRINAGEGPKPEEYMGFPAARTGLESALLDMATTEQLQYFDAPFTKGKAIPINGLVWMGSKEFMYEQIVNKIEQEFKCIKLKVAAIDFHDELELIRYIRKHFSADDIQIRLDANGGFHNDKALSILEKLSEYDIHSIEQPVKQGQWELMAELCDKSPLAIALDEELIGVDGPETKRQLLEAISPAYIILKPSLLGGFKASEEWIQLAEEQSIEWWATSALESNIGLSAIAQWVSTKNSKMFQGLGTGLLFSNNIDSPLFVEKGFLHYGESEWKLDLFM